MIFGDEKRMGGSVLMPNGTSAQRKSSSTEKHLGPGSYFTAHNEEIRGGWIKRSFSNRQPMIPGHYRKERNSSYVRDDETPGPGSYYAEENTNMGDISPRGLSSYSGQFDPRMSAAMSMTGAMKSGTKRNLNASASISNGVFFQGNMEEESSHLGPGQYYDSNTTDMVKKSFNVRAQKNQGSYSPRRGSGSPNRQMSEEEEYYMQQLYMQEQQEQYGNYPVEYSEGGNETSQASPIANNRRTQGRMTMMEKQVPTMYKPSNDEGQDSLQYDR